MLDVPDNPQGRRPPAGFLAYSTHLLRHQLGPWLAVAALLAAAGLGGALLVISLEPINPIQRSKLLDVDPADRVIDRDERQDFFVVREVCSSRAETMEVVRAWTEVVPDGQVRPTMGGSVSYFDVSAGCSRVRIKQTVPMSLPPGQYVFEVGLRRCSRFGQCESHRLDVIPVALKNGPGWPKTDVRPPSPRSDGVLTPMRSTGLFPLSP